MEILAPFGSGVHLLVPSRSRTRSERIHHSATRRSGSPGSIRFLCRLGNSDEKQRYTKQTHPRCVGIPPTAGIPTIAIPFPQKLNRRASWIILGFTEVLVI